MAESEPETFSDPRFIQSLLPHRYPILLIDRVLEIEPKKRIVAYKNVSYNEPFFSGHFPGHPIMPGVLVIEAMAQTAGILLMYDLEDRDRKLVYFSGIERARFRRPIVPGDRITVEVEVERLRAVHARFRGRATVDGRLAVEAVCSSTIVDR